ncbi:TonB-dependent siderophore receptor [Sulfurospirillum barnesii]|uniref:TonB-dependent siderophore receptor n=1 Tax=Sulfurospirillum barnesii (strain ATCC 700032 / DSM 10660 / SES-3) TaxID=760154 RepID=I3XZA7_SULBS|nr:TonB-dependent siderophore receptor [Sulfurospirillum barnesii]AFL69281.1 TonB-dependent siderophore receptor [Sulfurospirillum barnesii SES-3]
MNLLKKSLLSSAVALLMSTHMYADEIIYSLQSQPLKDAIERISKQSKTPYIVKGALLEGKQSREIKEVKGTKNALNKLLENSGLEAVIEDGAIIIQEKKDVSTLNAISISASQDATTEGTGLYTTKSTNTATKLSLSMRETPQSVTVLTQQKLEDIGVTSYQDVLGSITGITLNRWDERINSSARGFDLDYYKIDGLPIYSTWNDRDIDLSMYDRIEVVRGANGLTTGYGNPAMSINMVRKRANSKEPTGSVVVSGGSWDAYSATTDISSGINESGSVRGRLIAKHEDEKSFMDGYTRENNLFYGVIDADVGDFTYISGGFSYQKLERDGIRWGGLPAFYTDGTRTHFSRSLTVSEDWTYWNTEEKSVFMDLEHVLYKDITLNARYLYSEIDTDTALLYFAGAVNKSTGGGLRYMDWEGQTKKKQHTFDVNVNIPFELAGLAQEIITGVSYNIDKTTKYDARYPNGYYTPLGNFYNYTLNLPAPSGTDVPYTLKPEEIEQKAVYLAGNFSLMEDLKLITGARVSSWEYSSDDTTKETRKFDNELTPYVGLVYDLDQHHSVYASYTNIFNPQDKKNASGSYLDPIVGNNYEVGIKGEYFGGLLNTSFSLFKIKQDNVAQDDPLGVFVPGTTTVASVEASGVTSKGFEFDVIGQITDNFSLDFGVANFKAEDADGETYNTKASRTTANLFAKYEFNALTLGGGLNYKSKYYTGSGATKITQDAYTLASLMVAYAIDKNMKLQLNVNNLFDKKYYEGIGNNSMVYGAPRNATLSFKYTF